MLTWYDIRMYYFPPTQKSTQKTTNIIPVNKNKSARIKLFFLLDSIESQNFTLTQQNLISRYAKLTFKMSNLTLFLVDKVEFSSSSSIFRNQMHQWT